jgi:hypothetical protein
MSPSNRTIVPDRRRKLFRGPAAVVWGLAFFAGCQIGFSFLMDRWQPELCDPEYGYKLHTLRGRSTSRSGRPLLVAIGSSRTNLGLRPEVLGDVLSGAGQRPVVFNFALNGSGPLLELICLRRLLADGIRPDWLVIEVHPALLNQDAGWAEESALNINRIRWVDLPALRRLASHPWLLLRQWCRSRMTPCFSHRFCIMTRYAPEFLPWESRQDGWRQMDRSGWMPYKFAAVDAARYRKGVEYARREYTPALAHFHISPLPDRAVRDMLTLCRQERIPALLLLMPEGSEFRSWYPPTADKVIADYLAGLCREYGTCAIDARTWIADHYFFDSHHLLPCGATDFTRRFGGEVLAHFLAAKR